VAWGELVRQLKHKAKGNGTEMKQEPKRREPQEVLGLGEDVMSPYPD
jgi:hypothetical protein